MALKDDLVIDFDNRLIHINAQPDTLYTWASLYRLFIELDQDLFDEIGGSALARSMAYPATLTAQTPTDFTLKDEGMEDY